MLSNSDTTIPSANHSDSEIRGQTHDTKRSNDSHIRDQTTPTFTNVVTGRRPTGDLSKFINLTWSRAKLLDSPLDVDMS